MRSPHSLLRLWPGCWAGRRWGFALGAGALLGPAGATPDGFALGGCWAFTGVVQTFLPYPEFVASAVVLDDRRLGKQRVDALQILRALTRERYGWKHHPAVRMWSGHEDALACYAMEICAEWVRRGHADTCAASICADLAAAGLPAPRSQPELAAAQRLPPWLGDERLHRSHRARR